MATPATGDKTLVFHIGDRKTGTTALQYAFASGRVELKGHSLFYPAKISHNRLAGHFEALDPTASSPKARKKAEEACARLAQRIGDSEADLCLISGEMFESVPAATLQHVIDSQFADCADRIRVVAYVRPHAGRFLSGFTERVKLGGQRAIGNDLDGFLDQALAARMILYHDRFSALKQAFGDRFVLRPMIPAQLHRNSVIEDFIRHGLGVEEFTLTGAAPANESLGLEDLMRLKTLQRHFGHLTVPRLRMQIGAEFSHLVSQMPPPPIRTRLQLHRSVADRLQEACRADAQAMDAAFFDGAPLMETELNTACANALETAQSLDPADYLSASEARSFEMMAQMIRSLLENTGQDWTSYLHDLRTRHVHGD
ncbi:MAG: hypothetical protein AB7S99_01235 [Pseudodonghicola sp.]